MRASPLPGPVSALTLLLLLLLGLTNTGAEESSDAYLRNVVNELQIINGVAPDAELSDYPNGSDAEDAAAESTDFGHVAALPATKTRIVRPTVDRQIYPDYQLQNQVVTKSSKCLHQPVAPVAPSPLGFSPAELASMYRKALEHGTPLKYDVFLNTLNEQSPKITPTALEYEGNTIDRLRPDAESQYAYYFYPLQTFRQELVNRYGYKTLPNFNYETAASESIKKETNSLNPVFMGIGSFIGMALFFILSLYFYPRLLYYVNFPFVTTSRANFHNDFLNLVMFVTEAIDYYNESIHRRSQDSTLAIHARY